MKYEETYGPVLNPVSAFAKACDKIGWGKKLGDLSEQEVTTLIYLIQEAGYIKHGSNIEQIRKMERNYQQWTGRASPSQGIPF